MEKSKSPEQVDSPASPENGSARELVENGTGEENHIDPMFGTAAPLVSGGGAADDISDNVSKEAADATTDAIEDHESDGKSLSSLDIGITTSQLLDYINESENSSINEATTEEKPSSDQDRDSGTGEDDKETGFVVLMFFHFVYLLRGIF